MKIIKNKERLEFILSNENPEWQKIVYEKTGVIAYFNNSNTGDCYIDLISFCGYIDAEIDSYNSSGYCEILSISSFIENILQAKSYTQYLKDVSLGVFPSRSFTGMYIPKFCVQKRIYNINAMIFFFLQ